MFLIFRHKIAEKAVDNPAEVKGKPQLKIFIVNHDSSANTVSEKKHKLVLHGSSFVR